MSERYQYDHGSCKHLLGTDVAIFDEKGILRIKRPATVLELQVVSPFETLCLEQVER